MKNRIEKLILIFILLLALFLRILGQGSSPPGFNADEASLGYNAYSLLKTGRDEWGESWPLVFKSFGDYKPGVYVYLAIPFIWAGGLSETSVRLPSILLGVFSVLVIFALAKKIFKNSLSGICVSVLLAISPWHIHFSRAAWETNIATFFMLLGLFLFLQGLTKTKYFYLSLVFFILAMYSYQATRIIVPLFLLGLTVMYFKQIFIKQNILLCVLGLVLILPLGVIFFQGKALARFQGVSIFTDTGIIDYANQVRGDYGNQNKFLSPIFHSRISSYGLNFLTRYLDHFSPNFLFISGDPLKRNKVPQTGQLYLFELLTLILGLVVAIRNVLPQANAYGISSFKKNKYQNLAPLFLWIVLSPVAAALTYQTPHALRAHNMVIPLTMFSGLGLSVLLERLSTLKPGFKLVSLILIGFIIIYSLGSFLDNYFIHLPKQYALEWQYGFRDLMDFVKQNQNNFNKIVITDRYDQPYILYLFYSSYQPNVYQKLTKRYGDSQFGFLTISGFDKFEFRSIGRGEASREKGVLFAGTDLEVGADTPVLKTIEFPNGDIAFRLSGKKL